MNINQFLIDLSILSQKHGIKIEGCIVNDKNENLTWTIKETVADNQTEFNI